MGKGAHRWPRRIGFVSVVLVPAAGAFVIHRAHGPDREYRVDLAVVSARSAAEAADPLLVGAAQREITPRLEAHDTWVDRDGDGTYDAARGDRCTDRDGNGRCDLIWLAGFATNRPAREVNDPLWVRVIALRQSGVTLALASLDVIGLTHERVVLLRHAVARTHPELTHLLVASTHTHSAPDTLNLWSERPLLPGLSRFDEGYVARILERTREAVVEALTRLEPADAVAVQLELPTAGWVRDSRPPFVYDRRPGALRFVRAGSDETIATLVSWGCHPEALGRTNNLVSSDYPHYWREGLERGLPDPGGVRGLGGVAVFFVGSVGGLLTPMGVAVPDRDGLRVHREDGVGKARALGQNLAALTIEALRGPAARQLGDRRLAVVARTVFVPVETLFRWPILLGLIHPGWYGGRVRTEVNALRIGEVEILALPGEAYPEIVEGGVEAPAGGDFSGPPRETPPLRAEMKGAVRMVFGLANDEVGYIIPRTQWDERAPFTYGLTERPYGEEMSLGPSAAEVLHGEGLAALERLHGLTP